MAEKKKYEVLFTFKDLQDKKKRYVKGETFPRPANKKVSEERIQELLDKKAIEEKD